MKNHIIKAWNGEERLWKVFWLYNILGMYLFARLSNFLLAIGAAAEKNSHNNNEVFVLISSLAIFAYLIWAVCSLWRCAFNVERKWWGYLGRAYVVCFVFSLLLMIILLLH